MSKILILFASSAMLLAAQTIPVPQQYQATYSLLSGQISAFDATVQAGWNGSKSPVMYSPQLQSADSGEFTALLAPYYYSNVVLPELEEEQALGSPSVTVHISFPILYPPFYGTNVSQYQQLVRFYQQLASDIHARGMKMIVESVTSSSFPGNMAATYFPYYQSLSWNDYMTGRAQNALNVAQLVQPDYISVITEPDTEQSNTGQANAGTVSGSTQLLQTIVNTFQNAGETQIPIGAGAGTWINSFTSYVQNFCALPIQYIDTHVYPVNNNLLTNLLTVAPMIQAAGKQQAISEAWLLKVNNSEVGVIPYTQSYARDPFSFWEPLDMQFLQSLMDFSNSQNLLFFAPFWSHYFYAYLDYNTYGTLPANQVLTDAGQAAAASNQIGAFTPTGSYWLNAIIPAPDIQPPAAPPSPVATGVYANIVTLNIMPTTDNVGVAAYNLYRNGNLLTTSTIPTYQDLNLVPGETYTYTTTAFDASGNVSAPSQPLIVETVDTTPPSVPTGLTVTGTTNLNISMSWNASTGIGGVGGYRILRGTTPNNMIPHGSTTTTSYTDPYCYPATTYYYAVESYNPLQIPSGPSAAVSATTQPNPR